jgi:peptide deformylase
VAIRKIITKDNELRKKSKAADGVSQTVRGIFKDMAETMYSKKYGGGLAACQIGILSRLVIADTPKGLLRLVNPEIIETAGEQTAVEGCLSIPGVWGKVKRPWKITVKALNHDGRPITFTATADLAKCLCHEIDHLDGILFTDKVIEYVDLNIVP